MTQEALKLALKWAENHGEVVFDGGGMIAVDSMTKWQNAIKEALAQTQEPVAWMWDVNNGAGYSSRGIGFYQTDIPFAKHTPLYTHPPQRTWVDLTDEEIQVVAKQARSKDHAVTLTNKLLRDKNA